MFCDIFTKQQAIELIKGKKIWFIGSSNMRAIYKDLLWLITHEDLAPDYSFKVKNEPSYLNDKLLSNGSLHNGHDYKETREFKTDNIYLFFHFITRLYLDHFIDLIKNITPETSPDIIFLNSCLWDLSRWGPNGPGQFKENMLKTMKFLKTTLPAKTRVIWKTSLPVSISADGAIFIDNIKFQTPMLPWHILEANIYASTCANAFNYDTLDFHHYMRLQGHLRVKDGIHWQPIALRYLTNVFLTHLCLCWRQKLPGNFKPSNEYLQDTTKIFVEEKQIMERVNKPTKFFNKLFAKIKQTKQQISTCFMKKNNISNFSKNISKNKRKKIKKKLRNLNNKGNIYKFNKNQMNYLHNENINSQLVHNNYKADFLRLLPKNNINTLNENNNNFPNTNFQLIHNNFQTAFPYYNTNGSLSNVTNNFANNTNGSLSNVPINAANNTNDSLLNVPINAAPLYQYNNLNNMNTYLQSVFNNRDLGLKNIQNNVYANLSNAQNNNYFNKESNQILYNNFGSYTNVQTKNDVHNDIVYQSSYQYNNINNYF